MESCSQVLLPGRRHIVAKERQHGVVGRLGVVCGVHDSFKLRAIDGRCQLHVLPEGLRRGDRLLDNAESCRGTRVLGWIAVRDGKTQKLVVCEVRV